MLLAGLLALAAPARAAFPGTNGKIAFTSDPTGLDLEVYGMNANGTAQTDLTNNPNSDSTPTWSPDGEKILFSTDRDVNDEIYVMNADGSSPTSLTNDAASDTSPTWSPDGQKIAFTRDDGSFDLEIWSMNADGSGQTNLTNNLALDTGAAWSPNGQKIAFTTTRDGNAEIYVMNPNGTGQANLTNNSATDSGADWSPDGQRIAFASRRDGNAEIYVMNADGTNATRITTNSTSDFSPAWSPDGQQIAFRTNRDGSGYEIYVMNADGSNQTRLTTNATLDVDPDWQPVAPTGYPRPAGATPLRVSLVPAFEQCTAPNRTHGPPLVFGSCNPVRQRSPYLTVGTPDANGAPVSAIGLARFNVCLVPACAAPDVRIEASMSDVRCKAGAAPCGAANLADGPDYTGELELTAIIRITDKYNGSPPDEAGTVTDIPYSLTMACAPTVSTSEGSSCSLSTTANSVTAGTVRGGTRAIWELGQVEVSDGGADGDADTAGDNQLFANQGVFVP